MECSRVKKRCANDASRVKDKDSADVTIKIMKVVEACPRDRRDLIREVKMRIKKRKQGLRTCRGSIEGTK